MILVLDKHRFKVDEVVSGEISASGHQCALILTLTCKEKLKILQDLSPKTIHKSILFNHSENLTDPQSSFTNITFPFTFRLSTDLPSTYHMTYTNAEEETIEASLEYKIKAKLIRDNEQLEKVSKIYTVVGRPAGRANYSTAEYEQVLLRCCPWSLSIRVQVPDSIKIGDSVKNFRVFCTRLPKYCRVLRIEGKIVYKGKILVDDKELIRVRKVLKEAVSNGDDFSIQAAIVTDENNCSYCSEIVKSKYRLVVNVVYRVCCLERRAEIQFDLNVTPKDVPSDKIEELPMNFTLHQLKTIELKNSIRSLGTGSYRRTANTSYRRTAATIDSESNF